MAKVKAKTAQINLFLEIQLAEMKRLDNGDLLITKDGTILFADGPIPLVVLDNQACCGVGKIAELKHEGGKTVIRMTMLDNIVTGDPDKFQTYYDAYRYLDQDKQTFGL